MRNIFFILFLWVSGVLQAYGATYENTIIPAPAKIVYHYRDNYTFRQLSVTTSGFSEAPERLLSFAREIVSPGTANTGTPGLQLVLDASSSIPVEGYKLAIDKNGIKITSSAEQGIFYGLQTLLQLIPEGKEKSLPYMEIEDAPRFRYRGLHLDVGRHIFPVSFIKQYIDLIARYKLNTFHWHLTEDQGWRIEIKKYPKLAEIAAYRDQTVIGHSRTRPAHYDGIRYGGYYTQEEIKDIVAYAASKYVTIIPEIDMPGHMVAALAAYPELACGDNPGPFKVMQTFGVMPDVLCAGKETTYRFIEDVMDEVLALFPGEYIHIGGDECPKIRWEACPYCRQKIKKEKLKDEHELQSYFINRIEKYLNKKGRQIIGWDEILEGGLAPNATVMSWRGEKGGIAAAQQHHDVIMTPNTFLYLDYPESISPEEPLTIGKNIPLSKVYSYDPVPSALSPEQQKHIKGVQANVWTEYILNQDKVTYMLIPRLFALSEIAWTAPEKKNRTNFLEKRVPAHLAKMDKAGVYYRVPEPIGVQDTTISASSYTLNCKPSVAGAKIYYTINGYTPTEMDYLYTEPVTISVPTGEERVIKTVVITPSGKRSVVVTTVVNNDGFARRSKKHTDLLLEKLHSEDRNYVFVISHRADWRNAPENSLPAIERAIKMGVDMVELDIQQTKDGQFILMHDTKLDRTSNGKGKIADYTLEEISKYRLKSGHGVATEEKIPTLEEALLLCKDRVLVNIDKGGEYIKELTPILQRTGTEKQVIIKGSYPVDKVKTEYGNNTDMLYMPIVQLGKEGDRQTVESFLKDFRPVAIEICFKDDRLVDDAYFKYISATSRVWINSLWNSLCGGHSDDRAIKDPNTNWGWILQHRATMIQTDRPQELIEYLKKNNRRSL
ncbi:MAG: family 20 glycosylhydrolase [Dysgonamonadaceae bacterium]|jgi:hexosaminidase|nr:family 20 glycosylhydrolase [Dysgonamonadaceae bacterium]